MAVKSDCGMTRRYLVRTLVIGGDVINLAVVTPVGNHGFMIDRFVCETHSTLFVDLPLAVVGKSHLDDAVDELNRCGSVDQMVALLLSGRFSSGDDDRRLIILEPGECRPFDLKR